VWFNWVIPVEWLQVKISPISKTETNQYRPIALMPYICKIVETIFNTQITHCLEQNSTLPPNEFGFGHQTSALDCVSTLVADINQSFTQYKRNLS